MFRLLSYRLGASLGLSLLLVWLALPGIGLADDDDDKKKNNNESQQSTSKNKKNNKAPDDAPDLEVLDGTLFKNTFGQVNDRLVAFRVANIGTEDALATTALIEITGSSQAFELKVPVPALKAGGAAFYGTAELPGPCDGHSAEVSVDLKGDASLSNNSVGPNKLCPEKPKAPQGSTSTDPTALTLDQARQQGTTLQSPTASRNDPASSLLGDDSPIFNGPTSASVAQAPEYKRPGTHTLTFEPSKHGVATVRSGASVGCFEGGPLGGDYPVGWWQAEFRKVFPTLGLEECNITLVAQTAVKFDLAKLDELPRKAVTRATLTFDEEPIAWTDSEGRSRVVPGCVAQLSFATVDWTPQPYPKTLFPNEPFDDVTPSASREWNVTSRVQSQLQYPQDRSLRYGYILRGSLEDVEGEDETSCLSDLSNIRLTVTYVVPDN